MQFIKECKGWWKHLVILCAMALSLVACQSGESEEEHTPAVPEKAYVALSTRTSGAQPSLNADTEDYEDRVITLRLLAFNHATGEIVYNHKYDDIAGQTSYDKLIEMKVGDYDIYAVANELPTMTPVLDQVRYVDALYQLPELAEVPYDFEETNVSYPEDRTPFLMTAIVNHKVVEGQHTAQNPLPIEFLLVRSLAKTTIDVVFDDVNNKKLAEGMTLSSVALKNVPQSYSLFPPRTAYAGTMSPVDPTAFRNVSERSLEEAPEQRIKKTIYIPEYLCASTVAKQQSMSLEFYYYKHGVYKSQNLTIDHQQSIANGTMTLSRYSVVRNHDYTLEVRIKGWDEELIVYNWHILPWNVLTSYKDFSAVSVEHDATTITQNNVGVSVEPTTPRMVYMHAGTTNRVVLSFTLSKAAGAVWRFGIDNPLDFKLEVLDRRTQTPYPNNTGILANSRDAVEVDVVITALKPYRGQARTTELYLTVDGKEVQIVPALKRQQIESSPNNRYAIQQSL